MDLSGIQRRRAGMVVLALSLLIVQILLSAAVTRLLGPAGGSRMQAALVLFAVSAGLPLIAAWLRKRAGPRASRIFLPTVGLLASERAPLARLGHLLTALQPRVRRLLNQVITLADRLGAPLGLLARAITVLVVWSALRDPTGQSLPGQLISGAILAATTAVSNTASAIGGSVAALLAMLAATVSGSLILLVAVVAALAAEQPVPKATERVVPRSGRASRGRSRRRIQSTTKAAIGRAQPSRAGSLARLCRLMVGVTLPTLAGLVVRLAALSGLLVTVVAAWVGWGWPGLLSIARPSVRNEALGPAAASNLVLGLAEQFAAIATTGAAFGWSMRHRARRPTLHHDVLRIHHGSSVKTSLWSPGSRADPTLRELAWFANTMAQAMDHLLAQHLRPAGSAPRNYPEFEIRASEAETVNGQHLIALQIEPLAAMLDAARLDRTAVVTQMAYASRHNRAEVSARLDFDAKWPDLAEEHRGLFFGFHSDSSAEAAATAEELPLPEDKFLAAIVRGLRENKSGKDPMALADDYFRLIEGPTRGWVGDDFADTYVFTTGHRTEGGVETYRNSVQLWEQGMVEPLRYFAHLPPETFRLTHDDASHTFILRIGAPAPPFPGDVPSDRRIRLSAVLAERGIEMAKAPRRFIAALDKRGEPLWVDLANPLTPHVLIMGAPGGGKSVTVASMILQLAAINPPSQLRLWLADSPKLELKKLYGNLPHIEHLVVNRTGKEVQAMLQLLRDTLKANADRKWSAKLGEPWHFAIIEEWQALMEGLRGAGKEGRTLADEIENLVAEIAAIGRAPGFHVAIVTQKGTSDVVSTRISNSFAVRIVGRTGGLAELQTLTYQQDIRADRPGRLVIQGIVDTFGEVRLGQGLIEVAKARDAGEEMFERVERGTGWVVAKIIERDGPRTAPVEEERPEEPDAGEPPEPDEEDEEGDEEEDGEEVEEDDGPAQAALPIDDTSEDWPRRPSDAQINELLPHTALRLLYMERRQLTEACVGEVPTRQPASKESLTTFIRNLPGRREGVGNDRLSAALDVLARAGCLYWQRGRGAGVRVVSDLTWPVACQRLENFLGAATPEDAA